MEHVISIIIQIIYLIDERDQKKSATNTGVPKSSLPPPSPSTAPNQATKAPKQAAIQTAQRVEESDTQSPPQESTALPILRIV